LHLQASYAPFIGPNFGEGQSIKTYLKAEAGGGGAFGVEDPHAMIAIYL